ncbi:uncharacterized protein LOC129914027 [Episyrphus balteatus]|uniref:uncharacterized protein LOC129914027 n=1 Tax=Episyrphus balteatus TaxID=286459 RepID=UPI002486C03C|nr:uncharacterized protein LOC129914027 [Episyrphus balteatus]
MTTKKCAYKNCGAFTNSSHPSSETFYSFPKHPEKLEMWMKLGGVRNEKELAYASRYFCSKHFDETKYVANNPRRKQLLSAAIPYPCVQSPQPNVVIVDENEYQCVVSSRHTIEEEPDDEEEDEEQETNEHGDEITEEVANEINCISETLETFETYDDYQNEINCSDDFEVAIEPEKRSLKRKIDHSSTKPGTNLLPGSVKRTVSIVSNCPTSTINLVQDQLIEDKAMDEDLDLINTQVDSNVTTFIFKGEEYIQMPKEQYVREKLALINRIRSYEEVLKNVKSLMDNVKI